MKLGIDLGTTNTVVSYIKNGKIEYMKFGRDGELLKSLVAYKNSKIAVGRKAEKIEIRLKKNVIRSSKTHLGDKDKIWKIEDRNFTPTDVATFILKEIISKVKKEFPEEESIETVITVPAYFESHQVEETQKAGRRAGFDEIEILTEPVAAAIAYGSEKEKSENLFIIDIGGGTFDVAVVNVDFRKETPKFTVRSIEGDPRLGGDDFDNLIIKKFKEKIHMEEGTDLDLLETEDNMKFDAILSVLRKKAEELKIELSDLEESEVYYPSLIENYHFKFEMKRSEFENLASRLFMKIKRTIRKSLNDFEGKIDKVVLTGGSSRIPKIRELAEEFFERELMYSDMPLDKLVSGGAAIISDMKNDTGLQLEVEEILPRSLGIAYGSNYEKFYPILKKDEIYPIERTESFKTTHSYQRTTKIKVYEGNSEKTSENKLYEIIEISGLTAAPKGKIGVDITFKFDQNRILKITAKETPTERILITKELEIK